MGAYQPVVLSGNGNSAPVIINLMSTFTPYFSSAPAWMLGIVVTISSGGSMTYSVQVTCDPKPSSTGNWNNHDYLNSLTSSANSNVAFPITGIRLVVTNWGSGTCTMGICQWP